MTKLSAKRVRLPAVPNPPDPPCDHFLPMVGCIPPVPKNASWQRVRLASGEEHTAHWACDLSGEDQPPFRGWFIKAGSCSGFTQIDEPTSWRPLSGTCRRCLQPLPPHDEP